MEQRHPEQKTVNEQMLMILLSAPLVQNRVLAAVHLPKSYLNVLFVGAVAKLKLTITAMKKIALGVMELDWSAKVFSIAANG